MLRNQAKEAIKPQRQRDREMEVPSEARIPTPSSYRGESLSLEKEHGLFQVMPRAGGRAGTRAQPLGSQPSEPSAVLVLQREERVATKEAGSPGMDHRAQASRATRMAAVCAILGFGPSGLVWGCGFSFQEKVCLLCSQFLPPSRKHPPPQSRLPLPK